MTIVDVTLGEYMSNDLPKDEWDLKALSEWAQTKFQVNLPKNRLAEMKPATARCASSSRPVGLAYSPRDPGRLP